MPVSNFTEQELRSALHARSLDYGAEPDVESLRRRLLDPQASTTSHLRRTVPLIVAAACVLLAAGLFTALARDPHEPHAERMDAATLAQVRSGLLPGTTLVQTYRGSGPTTLAVPHHSLPENTQWAVYATCRGAGGFGVGGTAATQGCHGDVFGTGGDQVVRDDRLRVAVSDGTSWQVAVVIEPLLRTNGGIGSDVDPALNSDAAGTVRSHGTQQIRLGPASSVGSEFRVELVCAGSGVTLNGLRESVSGDVPYTQTCFAGRMYVWELASGTRLPVTVRVQADDATTWSLRIVG